MEKFADNYITLTRMTDELNKLVFDFCLDRALGMANNELRDYAVDDITLYVHEHFDANDIWDDSELLEKFTLNELIDYMNDNWGESDVLEKYDTTSILNSMDSYDLKRYLANNYDVTDFVSFDWDW